MSGPSLARRLAAALALIGVVLHGSVTSLVLAARADPMASLMALGALCLAGSNAAGLKDGERPDSSPDAGPAASCPICTTLAAINLAPPTDVAALPAPGLAGIERVISGRVDEPELPGSSRHARDPPAAV